MTSVWALLDRDIAVPVIFCDAEDGRALTNAAHVAAQRYGGDRRAAFREVAMSRVIAAVGEHLHLRSQVDEAGIVAVDLTEGDAWLGALAIETHPLAARANAIGAPVVRAPSGIVGWDDAVTEIGSDFAMWAVLRSASKAAPFVLGLGLAELSGRTDTNPLALVRRAHAACVVREQGLTAQSRLSADQLVDATGAADVEAAPDATGAKDGALRFDILAASRALHDVDAGGRVRPALLAVEDLARASLRHVERTPVTRTDLPALAVARSILGATLNAVGVAAPVPY